MLCCYYRLLPRNTQSAHVEWKEKGIVLRQETNFPESNFTRLIYEGDKPRTFILMIRKPSWATGDLVISMAGEKSFSSLNKSSKYSIQQLPSSGNQNVDGYIPLLVTMDKNRSIDIQFKMNLYAEAMPDNPNRIAFKYGPLVLAGLLGKDKPDPAIGVPVLLTGNRNISDWVQTSSNSLQFEMKGVGKPFDVKLIPFYQTYDQYYSVYWDYFTPADWEKLQADYEAEKKRVQQIETRTIDNFRIGEMQPERDHHLKASERSYVSDAMDRLGREARRDNYFEFDMKVDASLKSSLLLTYIGDDKDRKFDILIDGVKIATEEWKGGKTGKFYDVEYKIPAELIKNKTKITVRIEANYGKTAGRVFAVRIIKDEQ